MYQEIFLLTRGIEEYRLVEDASCGGCALKRSNALRRRARRPAATKGSTLKRAQSARKNFEKCIERCGMEGEVKGGRSLIGYLKCVKKFRMKQKQLGKILRSDSAKRLIVESEESDRQKQKKYLPWFLKWRNRKIQPVSDIR
ncbi:hypothetical protein JTB14_008648 [Gonioctena quinquepunctata]|nr:hypothetical protein JTB14_008648 [Gonioctena quinquepunctata]